MSCLDASNRHDTALESRAHSFTQELVVPNTETFRDELVQLEGKQVPHTNSCTQDFFSQVQQHVERDMLRKGEATRLKPSHR